MEQMANLTCHLFDNLSISTFAFNVKNKVVVATQRKVES